MQATEIISRSNCSLIWCGQLQVLRICQQKYMFAVMVIGLVCGKLFRFGYVSCASSAEVIVVSLGMQAASSLQSMFSILSWEQQFGIEFRSSHSSTFLLMSSAQVYDMFHSFIYLMVGHVLVSFG